MPHPRCRILVASSSALGASIQQQPVARSHNAPSCYICPQDTISPLNNIILRYHRHLPTCPFRPCPYAKVFATQIPRKQLSPSDQGARISSNDDIETSTGRLRGTAEEHRCTARGTAARSVSGRQTRTVC
ncbi:hypothetical protein FA95DRAFT_694275 [Auriscalpium vulgare]|uniref:Uncharacterized protein n=1 Tax=Auriscalpium vulgare TaxID=40419 RepID=A0ACB8RCP9_9AGAM|nr:hypothetical protein FA95DRAFT_694275 [Auriscalpium vulgare]